MESKKISEHFEKGLQYYRNGFYSNALQEFKIVKVLQPNYPNIDYYIQATQKKSEELSNKLISFIEEEFDEKIIELSNELQYISQRSFIDEISYLLKNGQYNKALAQINQVEQYINDSRNFLLLKASIQKRLGLIPEAENTLLKANKLYSNDVEIINNLAGIYMIKNSFTTAFEYLNQALAFEPNNPNVINNLGVYYMQINQLDKAREMFQKALKIQPHNKLALKNLNSVVKKIESLEYEIQLLRKEYYAHPNYIDLALKLAQTLIYRGYLFEAKNILIDTIQKKESYAEAQYYLAYTYELLGETENALTHYQKVAIIQNNNNNHLYHNVLSLLKEGYIEEALSEIKKIAILEFDEASAYIRLGKSYFEDALWQKALECFLNAISLKHTYPDAHYWAAMCYLQLGKKNKAKNHLLLALEINPKYADAHFQLGMIYKKISPQKAISHLQQAIDYGLKSSFVQVAQEIIQSIKNGKIKAQKFIK